MSAWLKAALLIFLVSAGPARAEGFFTVIQDLPLMPGLTELSDQGVVFDNPGGRIVEAYAQGWVAGSAVEQFYGQTLPQLGWTAAAPGSFLREGEQLELAVLRDGGSEGTLVRFVLKPR